MQSANSELVKANWTSFNLRKFSNFWSFGRLSRHVRLQDWRQSSSAPLKCYSVLYLSCVSTVPFRVTTVACSLLGQFLLLLLYFHFLYYFTTNHFNKKHSVKLYLLFLLVTHTTSVVLLQVDDIWSVDYQTRLYLPKETQNSIRLLWKVEAFGDFSFRKRT